MPSLDVTLAGIMLVSLIFYVVLGGADFGGGVWDLFSSGSRARRQRNAIADAIGPIWEANHVWLILVIVLLFTCFPPAFSAIMTALHIPITIMLIGIVLRGASFTFRHYDSSEDNVQARWGRIFAISSIVTPFLLGIVIGAISSGGIVIEDGMVTSGWFHPWLEPFALGVGGFTISLFGFLAAVFMTVEVAGDEDLENDFRRRALLAAISVGFFALLVFLLSGDGAPTVRERLADSWWTWPLQIATGLAAVGAIWMLWTRHYPLARALAVLQVSLILIGWGASIYP